MNAHASLLTPRYSLLATRYSLLTTRYFSLLAIQYSLLAKSGGPEVSRPAVPDEQAGVSSS